MGALHLGLMPWLISDAADADTLARQAELAESWGYRSFGLPEHLERSVETVASILE